MIGSSIGALPIGGADLGSVYNDSIVESLAASDIMAGSKFYSVVITESVSAGDVVQARQSFENSVIESLLALYTADTNMIASDSITETLHAGDTMSGRFFRPRLGLNIYYTDHLAKDFYLNDKEKNVQYLTDMLSFEIRFYIRGESDA